MATEKGYYLAKIFMLIRDATVYSLRLEQRNKSVVGNFSGNLVDSVVPYGFIY